VCQCLWTLTGPVGGGVLQYGGAYLWGDWVGSGVLRVSNCLSPPLGGALWNSLVLGSSHGLSPEGKLSDGVANVEAD
jgi:hypothetical protein